MGTWIRACARICRCARARARTACVGMRGGASVYMCEWVRAHARSERVGVRMCVYVHEAIFSRFKGLSPFWWYQCTTWGGHALRWLVRFFSVPPLVGCGGGLWGWVVCVGVYCSPLPCTWGRVRGCGCTFGGGVHLCVPTQACVRTCAPAYMRTPAPKRPNLCALLRTDAPPSALGCVRVCARQRPYTILSPSRLFLSNFFECMSEHIKKDKTVILYVTAYNIAIRESRNC